MDETRPQEFLEVALFSEGVHGVRLVGRSSDPDLVDQVRARLAAAHRRQLAQLEGPVRLVPDPVTGTPTGKST